LRRLGLYSVYESLYFKLKYRGASLTLRHGGETILVRTRSKADVVLAGNFLKNERETLDFLLENLRDRDTVWDIGANIGLFSLFCAKRIGAEGRVYAFEPEPATFCALEKNLADNHAGNVTPYRVALGAETGEAMLFTSADIRNQGVHSLVKREDFSVLARGRTVRVQRGDFLLREPGVRQPAAIKIDVEGAEFSVLRGLGGVLSSAELRALCIEVHPRLLEEGDKAGDKLRELLADTGLRLKSIVERGTELHAFFLRD